LSAGGIERRAVVPDLTPLPALAEPGGPGRDRRLGGGQERFWRWIAALRATIAYFHSSHWPALSFA
jgi:hypothetical protein